MVEYLHPRNTCDEVEISKVEQQIRFSSDAVAGEEQLNKSVTCQTINVWLFVVQIHTRTALFKSSQARLAKVLLAHCFVSGSSAHLLYVNTARCALRRFLALHPSAKRVNKYKTAN